MSAAAGRLAPSVLRAALLDGPAGADPAGVALVGLLEAAGLLERPAFAEWCVDLEGDDVAGVEWAEIDLAELACWWMAPLELTDAQRRMVRAALALVDLAAELRELPEATRWEVVDVLQAFVAGVGPADAGLAVRLADDELVAAGGGPR